MEKILAFFDSLPDNAAVKQHAFALVEIVKAEVQQKSPVGQALMNLLDAAADSGSEVYANSDRLERMAVTTTIKAIRNELRG